MDRPTRQVLLVVLVLAAAGAGYWIWERFYSHAAKIDAMHAACVAGFQAGKERVKSGIDKGAAGVSRDDPLAPIAKDLSTELSRLVDRFAGNVGEATCGVLREACRLDFESQVCRKARERFADR